VSGLDLSVLEGTLAIARLPANVPPPNWALAGNGFLAFTRTEDELSVVAPSAAVPEAAMSDDGWRAIRVSGQIDLSLTGVLASLATPLAEAGVPIFAVSTHDTDYVLVKDETLEEAIAALTAAGHHF
jgi:hypothetical protein